MAEPTAAALATWEATRANLIARDQAVFDHAVQASVNCQHDGRCKCSVRAKDEARRVLQRMIDNGWTLTPPPGVHAARLARAKEASRA